MAQNETTQPFQGFRFGLVLPNSIGMRKNTFHAEYMNVLVAKTLVRLTCSIMGFTSLTGCSIDGSITSYFDDPTQSPVFTQNRPNPDFIPGEIVTTSAGTPGYVVTGVFGETTTKQELSNSYEVHGVFYEVQ